MCSSVRQIGPVAIALTFGSIGLAPGCGDGEAGRDRDRDAGSGGEQGGQGGEGEGHGGASPDGNDQAGRQGGGVSQEPTSAPADQGEPEPDSYYPVALAEGLAPTPPMGWNSWNQFGCDRSKITADNIIAIAEAMVQSGMKDVGYQYVTIDDCWHQVGRTEDGKLDVSEGFPEGMKVVADTLHGLGLKLGIYSDRGTTTCANRGYPGSQDHVAADAATFAEWGVDYLKYDNCYSDASTIREEYTEMGEELARYDIVYSICAWKFYEWEVGLGHLWRTTSDISANWGSLVNNWEINRQWAAYAGPNGWNDPDMLEVGVEKNGSLDRDESRAHFGLWAIMAAPLIAGNDLTRMEDWEREILTNEEVIAINQDALGLQGTVVRLETVPIATSEKPDYTREGYDHAERSVWAKPLNDEGGGARAVLLLNSSLHDASMEVRFDEIGLRRGRAKVRDLFEHEDLGSHTDRYSTEVKAQGAVLLKIVGHEPAVPRGEVYLSDLRALYQTNGYGPVELDQSVGGPDADDGEPIKLGGGKEYGRGLGVMGPSKLIYRLGKNCSTFTADLGVIAGQRGSVRFHVFGDEDKLYESEVLRASSDVESIELDVTGQHRLILLVTNGDNSPTEDEAAWADARLMCKE